MRLPCINVIPPLKRPHSNPHLSSFLSKGTISLEELLVAVRDGRLGLIHSEAACRAFMDAVTFTGNGGEVTESVEAEAMEAEGGEGCVCLSPIVLCLIVHSIPSDCLRLVPFSSQGRPPQLGPRLGLRTATKT